MESAVVGMVVVSFRPFSSGGEEDVKDSVRLIKVTGGGLQRSYKGSPDDCRSCRVLTGAMIAFVTIAEWASNISTGRFSLSTSDAPEVDQMYALRSSLPQIMYLASSLNLAWI